MSRIALVELALTALLMAGTVGCGGPVAGAAQEDALSDEIVAVEAFAPNRVRLNRSTTQPATVHAWYEAHVFAKTSGYLTDLKADIGQSVQAGDVLAIVDVPEIAQQREAKLAAIQRAQADEQRAEAELAVARASIAAYEAQLVKAEAEVGKADAAAIAAKAELDRVRDLVSQKAVADRLLDESQAAYSAASAERVVAEAAIQFAQAERELSAARAQAAKADREVSKALTAVARRELDEINVLLKYSELTAPFDGVVVQRHVELGDLVRNTQNGSGQSGDPLFVVAQLHKVRVRVPVPERDAPFVSVGDAAEVTLQALPDEVFEGEVSRFAGVMDEQTRTMLVEIDLPNDGRRLLPGMFGQATIVLEPPKEKITLPVNAIRYDEQGASYVYTVNGNGEVEIVDVQTGLDNGEEIEIADGLDGSERVVGPSLRRFAEGQKVKIRSSS